MRREIERAVVMGVKALRGRGVRVDVAAGRDRWAVGLRGVGGFMVEPFGERVMVAGEIVETDEVAQAVDMTVNAML